MDDARKGLGRVTDDARQKIDGARMIMGTELDETRKILEHCS